MKKKNAYNPIFPSFEYIPDGEPHVFGNRVYLYGSHDRFNGGLFCLNDYVCYSASVNDLTDWRYEGVIYKASEDFRYQDSKETKKNTQMSEGIDSLSLVLDEYSVNEEGSHALYAPDVVKGNDGKYYLYYCFDCLPEIGVAVSDSPSGEYRFLGLVKHKDGSILGQGVDDLFQFDPGIFIDEDKKIYLYSGNAPITKERMNIKQGSQVMELEADMLTLKSKPKRLLPDICESQGTGFEGHEFFEASSIRKINGLYYLVYSSINSHELNYAISQFPDKDYEYGGTLVDIADIYLNNRQLENAVNCLGNTHGGIEKIGESWYIFYHRQTNRTNFSRQACAEKIEFDSVGKIKQVEVSSQGLHGQALEGRGKYPANICCHLTGKNESSIHSHPLEMKMDYPYLTQDIPDCDYTEELEQKDLKNPIQYIKNLHDESIVGYKYFNFQNIGEISLEIRGDFTGKVEIFNDLDNRIIEEKELNFKNKNWTNYNFKITEISGEKALYFKFKGKGTLDFRSFRLE
ncbi:MAG: family 43 glycosylhydrolase [Lactovum sp.]